MPPSPPDPAEQATTAKRPVHWDALAAVIASLIGLLALCVSGYTAYIQRQQVRAQVWPYLISGNNDLTQSLTVSNKGVGPAIVRSVQVRVDGKPQTDWNRLLVALGLPPHHFIQATINHDVLSPGEEMQIIHFPDKGAWERFSAAARDRISVDICFCSTLDDCWVSANSNLIGSTSMPLQVKMNPVDQCPRLPPADVFNN